MRHLVFALIFLSSGGIGASAVQAASSTPPATPAKFDPNEPYGTKTCTGTVTGRVISSTAIQTPNVGCAGFSGGFPVPGGGDGGGGGSVGGGGGVGFNTGRCKNAVGKFPRSPWGIYCPNVPWLTMDVQLGNPVDASKMPPGKVVTLKGDFLVITQNKVQYWVLQNAKVLYTDPFGR